MNNKNSYLSLIGFLSLSLITVPSSAFALRTEQGSVSMDAPLFCEPIAMMSSLRSCNVPGYKQIRTLEDLKRTSTNLRGQGDTKFILCNDIDASALGNQSAGNIADITIDGNGYTIRGLAQNAATTGSYFGGLFGSILRSNIKNLRLENFSAASTLDCGSLTASSYASTFENIIVDDATVSGHVRVGLLVGSDVSSIFKRISVRGLLKPLALVGENTINGGLLGSAKNSKISRVASNLTIHNGDVIGGIAGQLTNSSIEEASATIDVSFDGSFGQPPGSYEMPRITGGIVGFADCASGTCSNSIKKVYSSGTMNAGGTFGGILGRNALPSTLQLTEISDVRADVNVIFQSIPLVYNYGAYGRGGIVGHNLTGSLTVANALFSGSALFDPKVFPQTFGGIIGTPGTSSASVASFFDKSKTAHAVDSSGGMARSSTQLKSISTYTGWNISVDSNSTGTWIIPSASYPMLNGGIQPGTCDDTVNY